MKLCDVNVLIYAHRDESVEYACQWISTDGDFARFPSLDWAHPLQA
jgi:hypothetical protein